MRRVTPRDRICATPRLALAAALACSALAFAPAASAQEAEQDDEAQALPVPPADVTLPEVDPIITDEEFDDLVPDFDPGEDPELDRPLETIEEFERRLAGQPTEPGEETGEAAEGDLAGTPLSDETPVEAIADIPLGDEELLAPLPPLESFTVEPVEIAGADDLRSGDELGYKVEIAGIEEADAQTDADMRGLFRSLSALEDGDGEAANMAQIYARLQDDSALLRTILESEGWYEPSISTRVAMLGEDGDGALTAMIETDPGQRYKFGEVTIVAQPTVPDRLIEDNFPIESGQPIVAERVLGAEARIALVLGQQGYPFAELGERDIVLDRDTGEGDYILPVDTGPRARYGEFVSTGEEAFGIEHIAVLARFERGELYDSRDIDDLRKALVATGLFDTVAVSPKRTGESAGDDTEYVAIAVEQHKGPPRTIAARAGYGTGEGFRVEGSWTHRNLFPPEGALIVSGLLGTSEQGAGVTFRRSNAGRRDRTFQLAAELKHSNYDAFDAYTARLATLWSYDSTSIWQKKFTYAYGGQVLVTGEDDFDFDLGERRRRTFYIAGLTGQAGLDFTNNLLDPTRGFKLTALVEPEATIDGEFRPYLRTRLDASGYFPVGDSLVLAGRVGLGSIQGISRYDLAPSRRFYAGGGGSVRGFGYQALGPQVLEPNPSYDATDPEETDPPFIEKPLGGRSFNEASLEVRYRFGDYGVVGFVDVGQAYEATTPQFDDLRVGVGLGARYYTNFGPLRIDIATPLDRREGEPWLNIYVSIGQAF